MQIAVLGVIGLGLVLVTAPVVAIYWLLEWGYDGPKTVRSYRAFRACYAVGTTAFVAGTVAVPLSIRGAIGTGPAIFAPLLQVLDWMILSGLGLLVLAFGSYWVVAWRS